jgi:diguanylate cyclase (GGDEF)-like protein/PAS domain S-box-containing protein
MVNFEQHCLDPQYPYDQVLRCKHRNGSTVWIHVHGVAMRNEQGKAIRMLGLHHDITAIKQLEQRHKNNLQIIDELYASTKVALEEAEALFITSPDAKMQTDQNGFIVRVNSATLQLFGYSEAELIEMNVDQLVPERYRAAHSNHRLVFSLDQNAGQMGGFGRVVRAITKTKKILQVEVRLNFLATRYGEHIVATIRDVTEFNQLITSLSKTRAQNECLTIDATTDPLTGLYNRRYFKRQANKEFANSWRYKNDLSLILFDIDNFKRFNDLYGHSVGDLVLQQIGHSATEIIRNGDTLARFGGEEFIVLLPMTGLHAAEALAERIRQDVSELKVSVSGQALLGVTISAGVSARAAPDMNVQAVIERADKAMYEAKGLGRNCIVVSDSEATGDSKVS